MNDGPRSEDRLAALLGRLDGRGYKAYKEIAGTWAFDGFTLHVDHVQGDPFADPSRVRVVVPPAAAGLLPATHATPARRLGTAACLARAFAGAAAGRSERSGTGRSGEIRMEAPGQQVLPQTALLLGPDGGIEARFTVGLPARGRRVLGGAARRLLLDAVPAAVRATLLAGAHDTADLERHAAANEDAEHLRARLPDLGLVAFVADGSVLPRRSGVDDRPLRTDGVVPFRAPEELRIDVALPNAGQVTGMGVPVGVTLIVGGGFHGKSTLLRALQSGVYNHRPGDGRERVITVPDAVKVRAEDGRSVAGVDISSFIDGLPGGHGTRAFTTASASGSTSQAAAIVEALEAGARTLLVDEDTSAANFMLRDRRMQALVPKALEPITPFVDRIRELADDQGISFVLVLGGSGDYLEVADTVLALRAFVPFDVTREAARVAEDHPTGREVERPAPFAAPAARLVRPGSVRPGKGRRPIFVKVPDDRTLLVGAQTVDLVAVEQLVARTQTRAVGYALAWAASRTVEPGLAVPDLLRRVEDAIAAEGLDALDPRRTGGLAGFRRFELAAALNRLRSLRVFQATHS